MNELHVVRSTILYALRHQPAARFSELMKQAGLESDAFKFHIRALMGRGFIQKNPDGLYELTTSGKEAANNLDASGRGSLRQPKLSLLLVLSRKTTEGRTEYLMQQRLRQPFYEYWGNLSGPAQWGDAFEVTAKQEIAKQCGLTDIACTVHSFYRQTDYDTSGAPMEDKLFVIITAQAAEDQKTYTWPYGRNRWMTLSECKQQEKVFASSIEIMAQLEAGPSVNTKSFTSGKTAYSPADY